MSLTAIFQRMLKMAGVTSQLEDWAQLMASQAEAHFTEKKRAAWRAAKARVRSEEVPKNVHIDLHTQEDLSSRSIDPTSSEVPRKSEEAPAAKRRKKTPPPMSEAALAFWAELPAKSRERTSMGKVAKAWADNGCEAIAAEVMAGLRAWCASEKWQDGYAEGAHRWLNEQQWRNPPESKRRPAQGDVRFGHVRAETQQHTQSGKVEI